MIRATVTPHRASWTNPNPTTFDTGFQYLAHVPPMAIGPQFAPGTIPREIVPVPLGQDIKKEAGEFRAVMAVVVLGGLGFVIWLATRPAPERKREFRGSQKSRFGRCSKSCSGDSDFKGCMSSCASG